MDFAACLISALALAAALPNEVARLGIPALGFLCLTPFFYAVGRSGSYRKAAIEGALFGGSAHALSSYWLIHFQDFAVWTIGATTLAYALLYAIVACWLRFFSLASQGKELPGGRRTASLIRPFLLAAVWTVWEYAKSTGFLGYPWGLIPYSVADLKVLTQGADIAGIYYLTFFLALSSAVLAELVLPGRSWRPLAFTTLLGTLIVSYGLYKDAEPIPVTAKVPMVLVQHNGDSWEHGGEARALKSCQDLSRRGIAEIQSGSAALAEGRRYRAPALVVWSETVLSRPFEDYRDYFQKTPAKDPFIPFLHQIGVPLLVGAPVVLDWDNFEATNSVLLLSPEGKILYSYAKRHPVPFAEAIPLMEYQWMRDLMANLVGLEGGWTMGSEATVMEVPLPEAAGSDKADQGEARTFAFGAPICFEDAFADVCADFFRRGAQALINLTNDSWSKTVSAELQHFTAARFRAIEQRRVLVRSTNGGYTCVVGAKGEVLADLPLFTEDELAVEVPIYDIGGPTAYERFGDWLVFFILGVLALFFLHHLVATHRSESFLRRSERANLARLTIQVEENQDTRV